MAGTCSPTLIVIGTSPAVRTPRWRGTRPVAGGAPDFKHGERASVRLDRRAMETSSFLTGRFLLAMPGIGDPRFDRAVIAMCAHDADGALGIGIGETIPGLGLHALLAQLDIDPGDAPDAPVHRGGPMEPRRGFVLHSTDWSGQDTVEVAGRDAEGGGGSGRRWALSGTLDVLRAIGEGTGPRRWVVALGYAGWAAGQLDGEMTRHGWFDVRGGADLLFATPAADRWAAGFAGAGIDPRLLASVGGTA
ncbi:MAG: YqgE/AlgH family protein [Janthinobacterium lividum]